MSVTDPRLLALGERYFQTQHRYDPYNATLLGLSEFDGLAGDPSLAASERASADLAAIAREVDALDTSAFTDDDRIDHGVLRVLVRGAQEDAEHSLWAVNASAKGYVSRQGLVFQAVPTMVADDAAGAERYLSRLAGLGDFFDALGDRYAAEAAAGRVPTRQGVEHSIEQLEGHLRAEPGDDALLAPGRAASDPAVLQAATELMARRIRPALARLAARLRSELLPLGRDGDRVGIGAVPGGEAGYAAAIRRHTTTDLSAPEIHRIGLDVLREMLPEWSEIGGRALVERDFAALAARLRSDETLRFDTSDEIVAVARGALERAEAVRDRAFPPFDITDCAIEEVDPLDAAGSALGYYQPPAMDGSRPGTYFVLATEPQTHFRYEYESLSFHESVPGHHLQLAAAQTLDIPCYRRSLDVEACSFNEGWGLYSEQLADELGLYSDDLSRLGMLSFRALRACRLVVDTGLHHYGWSRERAIAFMYDNTATSLEHVTSEVDRYIAWPGQALAYMIGRREILRLREAARAALGDRFDLRAFHAVVLGSGAVPLTVLADTVTRWQEQVLLADHAATSAHPHPSPRKA